MQYCVMAPLLLITDGDWRQFKDDLRKLQRSMRDSEINVSLAVSTDVWWGLIQGEGAFYDNHKKIILNAKDRLAGSRDKWNWSYYDRFAWTLKCLSDEGVREGLCEIVWAPIMSFHQCGGNVGDDVNIPIPGWAIKDHEYVSERGNVCPEYISLWHDDYALPLYNEFVKNFALRYGGQYYISMHDGYRCLPPRIVEVNVSCGPAGELRYPSYNSHDKWFFPHYGFLQCYESAAFKDYKSFIRLKCVSMNNKPPEKSVFFHLFDSMKYRKLSSDYYKEPETQDFFQWYNHSLIKHGQRMIRNALYALQGTGLADTRLGIKLPGIHWNVSNSNHLRLGECLAGLIQARPEYMGQNFINGYTKILWALAAPHDQLDMYSDSTCGHLRCIDHRFSSGNDLYQSKGYYPRHPLKLTIHFTCAEMPDNNEQETLDHLGDRMESLIMEGDGKMFLGYPCYGKVKVNPFSKAGELAKHVGWVGHQIPHIHHDEEGIGSEGLELGIENALECIGDDGWNNIINVNKTATYGREFCNGQKGIPYHSINILRLKRASADRYQYVRVMRACNEQEMKVLSQVH